MYRNISHLIFSIHIKQARYVHIETKIVSTFTNMHNDLQYQRSDLRPCWDICHTDMTSRISTCIPMTYNTDAHALKDMVTIFETWSRPLRSDYLHHQRGCPQSHPHYSYARIPKTQGSRPNQLSDYNQRTSQQA